MAKAPSQRTLSAAQASSRKNFKGMIENKAEKGEGKETKAMERAEAKAEAKAMKTTRKR